MADIIEYKKGSSISESKNKIVAKGYILEIEDAPGGNKQSSFNVPSEMFSELIEDEILVRSYHFESILDDSHISEVYILKDDYKFLLGDNLLRVAEINKTEDFGYFIVKGETTKPQSRPANFDKISQDDKSKDYTWLRSLFNNSYVDSQIIYIINKINKTFTFDIDLREDLAIENATVDNEIIKTKRSNVTLPLQTLYFGAPGTGKSYNISSIIKEHGNLEEDIDDIDDLPNVFRITIFPEYSYHDFIGTVMPTVPEPNKITYDFVPGVFTESLKYAFETENNVYLILEEMSRGNIASIFGDTFQLLDRDSKGISEYRIKNNLIAKELAEVDSSFYNSETTSYNKIYLPSNYSILGTVNSTDQNVFVMDTAFKRRFDFEYVSPDPIKSNTGEYLNNFKFNLQNSKIDWIQFYTSVNRFIVKEAGLSEDKQIGQFFIKGSLEEDVESLENNTVVIKNKLLNYLWFDVNPSIFTGKKVFLESLNTFNEVYQAFEEGETNIFNIDFEENTSK